MLVFVQNLCARFICFQSYIFQVNIMLFVCHTKTSAVAKIFACIEFQLCSQHSGRLSFLFMHNSFAIHAIKFSFGFVMVMS